MVTVEEAKRSDIEHLIDLLTLLFSQEAEFTPKRKIQRAGLQLILEDAKAGTIFVLKEEGGVVIGMVSLLWTISTALGGKVAFLEDMIISPEYRGKGYGVLLVDYAISYAKKLTCKRITLLTDTDNDTAQRFYKRLGFHDSLMQPMRLLVK